MERFNSHFWTPLIRKTVSADLVRGWEGVSSWLEDQWKISERFQAMLKNIVYLYSEKKIFWTTLMPNHSDKPVHVAVNYAAFSFKKSSVKHPPQESRLLCFRISEAVLPCSFGKTYSASEFITRSFSFLCLFFSWYLFISNRFCLFVMGDGNQR